METRDLETFLAVAETNSITKAAERLARSQPTITRVIQDLEAELGFALLCRQGRGVQLSDEGLAFEEEARRLLDAFSSLTERTKAIAAGKNRALHVVSTAAIGNALLPDALAVMPEASLPAEIQFAQFFPAIVAQEVRACRADVGFCSLPLDMHGLRVERLYAQNVAAAVPAGDPLAALDIIPLKALEGRRLVTMVNPLRVPQPIARAMSAEGIQPGQVIRANVSYAALQLVQRAGAIAIVDPVSAYGIPVPGVVVRPIEVDLPFRWGAIVSDTIAPRNLVTSFIDAVEVAACRKLPGIAVLNPEEAKFHSAYEPTLPSA